MWPLNRGSAVLVVDILSCAFWRCSEMSGHFCVCAMDISFFLLYHVVRLFLSLLRCSFVAKHFWLECTESRISSIASGQRCRESKSLRYPLICFRVDWDLEELEFIVVFQSGKCQLKFRRRKRKRLDFSVSHFCSKEILCEE